MLSLHCDFCGSDTADAVIMKANLQLVRNFREGLQAAADFMLSRKVSASPFYYEKILEIEQKNKD